MAYMWWSCEPHLQFPSQIHQFQDTAPKDFTSRGKDRNSKQFSGRMFYGWFSTSSLPEASPFTNTQQVEIISRGRSQKFLQCFDLFRNFST